MKTNQDLDTLDDEALATVTGGGWRDFAKKMAPFAAGSAIPGIGPAVALAGVPYGIYQAGYEIGKS